jgi:hypothetical protein
MHETLEILRTGGSLGYVVAVLITLHILRAISSFLKTAYTDCKAALAIAYKDAKAVFSFVQNDFLPVLIDIAASLRALAGRGDGGGGSGTPTSERLADVPESSSSHPRSRRPRRRERDGGMRSPARRSQAHRWRHRRQLFGWRYARVLMRRRRHGNANLPSPRRLALSVRVLTSSIR